MARATASIIALLACGAAFLAVAGPATAAQPCWRSVVDDWVQDGHVDGRYSAACIEKALANVPEDIRAYSDFEEQAKAARVANSRRPEGSTVNLGGSDETTQPVEPREPTTNSKDETTPIQSVLGTNGNNADSVPIPLLVLLGLAAALILAGGAGFATRKIRARRPGA